MKKLSLLVATVFSAVLLAQASAGLVSITLPDGRIIFVNVPEKAPEPPPRHPAFESLDRTQRETIARWQKILEDMDKQAAGK